MQTMTATLALAGALALTACTGGTTPGGTAPESAPASAAATGSLTSEKFASEAETLRGELESAYNSVAVEPQPTLEQYDAVYNPIWERAQAKGITLTRRPYVRTDGFVLNANQAVTPGHALLTVASSGDISWCIASTDTLDPATLTEEQLQASLVNPREFVLLEGDCQDILDYLGAVLPLDVSDELLSEIEGSSTATLPPEAP